MAAFEHFKEHYKDMYDVKLKPRMLRTLIRKHLPDEKQPLHSSFELAKVVSTIQTHSLLSESFEEESTDQKLIQSWNSVIDDWVNRVLLLASSNMSDKCWAGICLLGLTCQECSSARFFSSYSVWFQKLLSHLQPPADSQFVKVASCTSLSDLLTRLGRFSNLKNDGTSHSGKLIQPILKLLNEDSSEAVWDGAVSLLHTIITFFPASIHHHYDKAEAAVSSKILSGKCGPKMLKKLGHCLALLPKSKGDEGSWSLMMQKILVLINDHLNDVFQGMEEEAKSAKVRRLLVPPGKDPPPPLGGHTSLIGAIEKTIKRSDQLLTSSVSTLMICCCKLLTSSYPVQVPVPICSLLSLIERVLMMDGSCPQTMLPFMTAMQQELICSDLPVLHVHSLDLLIAVIKGMSRKMLSNFPNSSQDFSPFQTWHPPDSFVKRTNLNGSFNHLLPHAAEVVRLVTKYFRRCALPELRIKLYSITRILLISMGVGMAMYLAHDIVDNASIDLNSVLEENAGTSASDPNSIKIQSAKRKRKHGASFESSEEQQDKTNTGLEVGAHKKHKIIPISLKMAALEALETLLTVGGVLGSESWRSSIDNLLIMIATYSCKGGWANEENDIFLPHESTSILADFQLAALRALLASLLAPARVRPPYLAQGLDLFCRGKQEAGTKIAGFCAYALLTLEVLIHPRTLALDDFPSACPNLSKEMGHDAPELDYEDDDFLLNVNDSPEKYPGKCMKDTVEPFKSKETDLVEKLPETNFAEKPPPSDACGIKAPEISEWEPATGNADVQMISDEDQIIVESHQFQKPVQFQEVVSAKSATNHEFAGDPQGTELKLGRAASGSDSLSHKDHDMVSTVNISQDKVEGSANVSGTTPSVIPRADKGKDPWNDGSDSDSSNDSFPDIVDADPDSDSD
ncbi:hypothetical protein SLEP1_g47481 [Rubroshorea leprosula]|uniref:Pre-rRNA-processing protein RIX1 N-terminal domain-containing protein n=1 Tax=Rubroshorea leprosula TaxID=152421 RepID=A0AAV5LSD0_9ROSI|nr:hypothetical protein SLEP1_g47481 [Rubroshorea leprosula]